MNLDEKKLSRKTNVIFKVTMVTEVFSFIFFSLFLSINITPAAETYQYVSDVGSYGYGDDQYKWPNAVAVDTNNNMYIVDKNNFRILKYDSEGNFVTKWGSEGTGNGEFQTPYGVATYDDFFDGIYVYVSDSFNNCIQKFDSYGNFVTKWGSYGTEQGQFDDPKGLDVDTSGYVYVADYGNHRIQKFDSDGNFITQWYGPSGYGDELNQPYDVGTFENAFVVVADTGNDRIQCFDDKGNFIAKWDGSEEGNEGILDQPSGIAVESSGNGYVYVTDTANHRIQKFTIDGSFITRWGQEGGGNGDFYQPTGIAVDYRGYVYVSEGYTSRVQKFERITYDVTTSITTTTSVTGGGDLVVYYPFNGSADDKSGRGNHGTVSGASLTSDRDDNANSAYSFDGDNDYIEVSDHDTLDLTGEFTITAWVKPESSYGQESFNHIDVVSKWGIAGEGEAAYLLGVNSSGKVVVFTHNGYANSEHESTGTIPAGSWSHIVGVREGTTLKVYINGVIDSSYSDSLAPQNSTLNLAIGQLPEGGNNFHGCIDEVRIYNRALSSSEIADLYQGVSSTTTTTPGDDTTTTTPTITTSIGNECTYGSCATTAECTLALGLGWTCINGCCENIGFTCPVALALEGDESKLETIRAFRDGVLNQTPEGQEIIRLYYEWSPSIVRAMEEDEEFKNQAKKMVDGFLLLIGGRVK